MILRIMKFGKIRDSRSSKCRIAKYAYLPHYCRIAAFIKEGYLMFEIIEFLKTPYFSTDKQKCLSRKCLALNIEI